MPKRGPDVGSLEIGPRDFHLHALCRALWALRAMLRVANLGKLFENGVAAHHTGEVVEQVEAFLIRHLPKANRCTSSTE